MAFFGTGLTPEQRTTVERRATELIRERGVGCSCGWGNADHSEDCTLERAWDAYCEEVADDLYPAFEDEEDECPECGNPLADDGFCDLCSQAARDFEDMAYGRD